MDFPDTPWTVILTAQNADPDTLRECLNDLFGQYREPALAYLRRRLQGMGVADWEVGAEDVIQHCLTRVFVENHLRAVDRNTGPFRRYFYTWLKTGLADWLRQQAKYESRIVLRLGENDGNDADVFDPPDPTALEAETIFWRKYAFALVNRAVRAVRLRYLDEARGDRLAVLDRHILDNRPTARDANPGPADVSPLFFESPKTEAETPRIRDTARELGLPPETVSRTLWEIKEELRAVFRKTVRDTVASDGEVEAECAWLRRQLL